MKKKNIINFSNDEIDLIEIFKIIWGGKRKIILITFITFLIGLIYYNSQPKSFEISLEIKPSSNTEFIKLHSIYEFINSSEYKFNETKSEIDKNILIINKLVLNQFISEISNSKRFIKVLKNTDILGDKIDKLTEIEQRTKLYKFSELFVLEKVRGSSDDYTLKFDWHDKDLGKQIIIDLLNISLSKFEKLFFQQLLDLVEVKRDIIIRNDLKKIEYLEEQYEIANTLGLESDKLKDLSLSFIFSTSNKGHPGYTFTTPYYLLGQQAIQKEINIIKNRKYANIANLEKKINDLKNDNNFQWIEYNEFLVSTKQYSNIKNILLISFVSGLIIGVFYVFVSFNNKFKKVVKKNN
tara:strand:+ start:2715 stop:3770 length:1056 start_codon:yes stop_codon:yes gene_type:complete